MALAVEHREVSDREPECARFERSGAALGDEGLVAGLCFGEGIDGHGHTVWPRCRGRSPKVAV
jgi:hypothetical protein